MLKVSKKYMEGGPAPDFMQEHVIIARPSHGEGQTLKYPKIPSSVKEFMPVHQQKVVKENIATFQDVLQRLEDIIAKMPSTYETDDIPLNKKTAYLHYFHGGSDWYIFEKDKGDAANNDFKQNQMFGFAILDGDWQNAEAGYISMEEINHTNVELDFHFEPIEFSKIKRGDDEEPVTPHTEPTETQEEEETEPVASETSAKAGDIVALRDEDGSINFTDYNKFFYIDDIIPDLDNEGESAYIIKNKRADVTLKVKRHEFYILTEADLTHLLSPKIIDALKGDNQVESVSINELVKGKNQFEINESIRALIKQKGDNSTDYAPQELQLLEYYEGSGGLAKEGEAGARLLDQFFTPDEIIKKMWGLAVKYGFAFKDANILEPAVGIGKFLKYIPENEVDAVVTYEVDETAFTICKLLYPKFTHHLESFESVFFNGKRHIGLAGLDKQYDLVIGNPPYREYVSKYSPLGEKEATGAFTFDQYFITRGIDVLKSGGLLVFIIPSSFMNNKSKYNGFKNKLAEKAELLEAFRLPSGVFGNTEVTTDIIVLKKK